MKILKSLLFAALVGVIALLAVYWLTPPTTLYRLAAGLERSVAGLELKTVEVDGFRWEYLEGGRGEPLLLLHGFSADSGNWPRLAMALDGRYRIIAPDLFGFGNSARPADANYGMASQAARVFAFADAIGLGSFDVAGNSMGGYIAGVMAAQQPARIRSLWLLAPAGVLGAPDSEMFTMVVEQNRNPLISQTPDDFEYTWNFIFSEPPFIPKRVRTGFAQRQVERREHHERIFAVLRAESLPLEQTLRGSAIPTLIQWGDEDRVLHPGGGPLLVEAMAAATLVNQPGVGHVPMMEVPKESARIYRQWRESKGL